MHWSVTEGVWVAYLAFSEDTEEELHFQQLSAGPNGELWAVDASSSRLYRRIVDFKSMKEGMFFSKWECIPTDNHRFTSISVGGLHHIWAIGSPEGLCETNEAQKTVLFRLDVKFDQREKAETLQPLSGLLRDQLTFEWKRLVVEKRFTQVDCNSSGEVWAIDAAGKLFHRLDQRNLSAIRQAGNFLNCYEPEEASAPNNTFFLLPGEDLDVS